MEGLTGRRLRRGVESDMGSLSLAPVVRIFGQEKV